MSSMQAQATCWAGRTTGPYFSMRNPHRAGKTIWPKLPPTMTTVPADPVISILLPKTFQMVAHVGAMSRPRKMATTHTAVDPLKKMNSEMWLNCGELGYLQWRKGLGWWRWSPGWERSSGIALALWRVWSEFRQIYQWQMLPRSLMKTNKSI